MLLELEAVGRERYPEGPFGCGLSRLWRKRWALLPVVGVEGGLLGEKSEDTGGLFDEWPGSDIMCLGVVMLRPPHFGHLRFSASPVLVDVRELERLLFLPLRRG